MNDTEEESNMVKYSKEEMEIENIGNKLIEKIYLMLENNDNWLKRLTFGDIRR